MGFYLYFCLIVVDYLIQFGVEIVSGLMVLLRLQVVLFILSTCRRKDS